MATIRKAVIPAAGLGKRFLPITKSVPKEMLPIVDMPALQYVAEEAVASGITELLIIVNTAKDAVIKYFSPCERDSEIKGDKRLAPIEELLKKTKITFAYQEEPAGNGAAILLAEKFAEGEPFAVLFGDDVIAQKEADLPVTAQLIGAFERTGKAVVGTQSREPEEAVKYGVIKKGAQIDAQSNEVIYIAEKPEIEKLPSDQCSLGRFILTPDIFEAIRNAPKQDGEVYLTSALNLLAEKGKVIACDFVGDRYDLGDKFGFLEANIAYHLRHGIPKEKIIDMINKL